MNPSREIKSNLYFSDGRHLLRHLMHGIEEAAFVHAMPCSKTASHATV